MREERIHDGGAALEVFDGFEKRHHRQQAHQAFVGEAGEAHLAGEGVHHEKVREAARHTHDERTQTRRAVPSDVLGHHGIYIAHSVGFGAIVALESGEGAGRIELAVHPLEALGLWPVGYVGVAG